MRGRHDEAQAVLTRLFGADEARRKMAEIAAVASGPDERPRFAELKGPGGSLRPIVVTGIGLAVFQQFVGINVVFYYGAVLWQSVGFTEADALAINILSGALSIAACLLAIALIDKVGRRPLLLTGSIGMAVTLGVMAACFASGTSVGGELTLPDGIGRIALVAANLYVVFFNLSWGPVMWVMLGEMFPNRLRGSALAVAGLAQWSANFLVSVSFPALASSLGLALTYGGYAAFALLSFFFVRTRVEETRGRELEAMQG
jgi:MFS transporter, SP family, sugar:H+ symporter